MPSLQDLIDHDPVFAENVRARLDEYRRNPDAECSTHPGQLKFGTAVEFGCPLCHASSEARRNAEQRQAVVDRAVGECVRRFPARYQTARLAEVCEPTVSHWARLTVLGDDPRSLLLRGPVGTGKTHTAFAAIRAIVTTPRRTKAGAWRGWSWEATCHSDLLAELRPRPDVERHCPEAVLERLTSVSLLLVDDLGAVKVSEWTEEATSRLIDARYKAMLPTIFTTNLLADELANQLGARITSRLAEECDQVALKGTDLRRNRSGR